MSRFPLSNWWSPSATSSRTRRGCRRDSDRNEQGQTPRRRNVQTSKPQRATAATFGTAGGCLLAWTTTLLALTACKQGSLDTALDKGFQKIFEPRKTPQQYMLIAVSSDDADLRRDAVSRIAKSKDYEKEWAVKGLVAIALLEGEPQTRCVALRALSRTSDPRATETALKILNYEDHPPQEVWPPVPLVRWDAALLLAAHAQRGVIPDEERETVYRTMLRILRDDSERHARIAAARALGYFPSDETLTALIAGLRDEDVATVCECESSLVRLTGRTHHTSPEAWMEWLEANRPEAFAAAGEIPPSRRPLYDNMVEKWIYDANDLLTWLWPGPSK